MLKIHLNPLLGKDTFDGVEDGFVRKSTRKSRGELLRFLKKNDKISMKIDKMLMKIEEIW